MESCVREVVKLKITFMHLRANKLAAFVVIILYTLIWKKRTIVVKNDLTDDLSVSGKFAPSYSGIDIITVIKRNNFRLNSNNSVFRIVLFILCSVTVIVLVAVVCLTAVLRNYTGASFVSSAGNEDIKRHYKAE